MRVVICHSEYGLSVECNGQLCAERRLIACLCRSAAVSGVPRHRVVAWVRRRAGVLIVSRTTQDGTPACSLPCILCRQVLNAFSLRWRAVAWDGSVVSDKDAPPSRLTHRQANTIFKNRKAQPP